MHQRLLESPLPYLMTDVHPGVTRAMSRLSRFYTVRGGKPNHLRRHRSLGVTGLVSPTAVTSSPHTDTLRRVRCTVSDFAQLCTAVVKSTSVPVTRAFPFNEPYFEALEALQGSWCQSFDTDGRPA